jgi:hypothetical protein
MNRHIFLPCCILLLAFALPRQASCAVPEVLGKNFIAKLFSRAPKVSAKIEESLVKKRADKVSQETLRPTEETKRHLNELIARGPENLTIEETAFLEWSATDDATKKRVKDEVVDLERRLKEEREQVEEKKLSEECARKFASALKQAACSCLKTRIVTGHLPDAQSLTDFLATATGPAEIECMISPLVHRLGKATDANVEITIKKVVESVAKGTRQKPSPNPKPSDETKEAKLRLIYLVCGGE